jgi:hypothetical protein
MHPRLSLLHFVPFCFSLIQKSAGPLPGMGSRAYSADNPRRRHGIPAGQA